MSGKTKVTPAVYMLLEDRDRVLLVRRCNTGWQDGNYSVPSGHIHEGETPTEAMIREAREEINLILYSDQLCCAHILYRAKNDGSGDRLDICFRVQYDALRMGEVKNNEPDKCDAIAWFMKDELPSNLNPDLAHVIAQIRQGIYFSDKTVAEIDYIRME